MSDVVVWEVEVFTKVDAFFVEDVSSVMINSVFQCVCCEAYILFFTFLTCD